MATDNEAYIVRAGFRSNAFMAGSALVDISGTFTLEDTDDVVSMLEITIRSIKRQVAANEQLRKERG